MKKILSIVSASLVLAGALLVASCSDADYDDIKTDTIKTLATPSNLEATQSYGSVLLTWDAVPNAAAYKVVRYDTSDKTDKSGTLINAASAYYSTTYSATNGKTAKVYLLDSGSNGLLTNGTKYKYEVTALATDNGYDTSYARSLYYKTGSAKSITITAEVSDTVDVASALASGVEFAFNKSNYAEITIPTVPGLEYKYRLIDENNLGKGLTNSNYASISASPLKDTYTGKYNVVDSNGTTVVADTVYQLFLSVRAKNTEKYGSNWTLVNTGLVSTTYVTSSVLSLAASNIVPEGKSKFMLVARTTIAEYDDISNYTFTLKSYKVLVEDESLLVSKTATVNEKLTMTAVSGKNTTSWGAEYTTSEIADGDSYVFVLERTRTSDGQINRTSTIITGEDNTTAGALQSGYDSLKDNLDFYYNGDFSYLSAVTNTEGTITSYESTATFTYDVGKNYEVVGIYCAEGYSATSKDGLESAFVKVDLAKTDATATLEKTYHEEGTYKYTYTLTPAQYAVFEGYPTNHLYALVVKDSDGVQHVVTTTVYAY